jgi:hypothetical protein
MSRPIRTYRRENGIYYCSSKERLIKAGLATAEMFPDEHEAWRGNGLFRRPDELLWSVQRGNGTDFIVMWGICIEEEAE